MKIIDYQTILQGIEKVYLKENHATDGIIARFQKMDWIYLAHNMIKTIKDIGYNESWFFYQNIDNIFSFRMFNHEDESEIIFTAETSKSLVKKFEAWFEGNSYQ